MTVSAETLLGVRDHPGEIAGWGPITAAHARRLAARDGVAWRRILTDPTSGAVLEVGRARYAPSAAITDLVLARDDGWCSRPGCAHHARDLDHATPFSGGGTTGVGNLHAVCRGCHTAKHRDWTVHVDPRGTVIWRTPQGHRSVRPAPDLRPEDRLPQPPDPVGRWATDLAFELRRSTHDATHPEHTDHPDGPCSGERAEHPLDDRGLRNDESPIRANALDLEPAPF